MKSLADCRLYGFIDTGYLHGRKAEILAAELCAGGADLIQLRAKQENLRELRCLADAILPITRAAGVGLVINDYPDLAREVPAEFCHLGQEDFFGSGFSHVAQLQPPGSPVRIGLSTHRPEEAQRAVQAGAHYVAVGPVFRTATKPSAQPVSLDYVRWAAAHLKVPWFAIGGITLENLDQVLAAGARRICVVSAILDAENVEQRCRQFRARIEANLGTNGLPPNS